MLRIILILRNILFENTNAAVRCYRWCNGKTIIPNFVRFIKYVIGVIIEVIFTVVCTFNLLLQSFIFKVFNNVNTSINFEMWDQRKSKTTSQRTIIDFWRNRPRFVILSRTHARTHAYYIYFSENKTKHLKLDYRILKATLFF